MNRYDKFEPLHAIDETALDVFELSVDGWGSEIHITTREFIGKYRYISVNSRLYSIISYTNDVTGTDITARDVLAKVSEDIELTPGTYTLQDLIKKVNRSVQVVTNGNTLPTIVVEENDNLTCKDAIDSVLAGVNVLAMINTLFNLEGYNSGLDLYYTRVEVYGMTWGSYDLADKVIAMQDYMHKSDTNPQYDTSRELLQIIGNINSKSKLKSWKSRMTTADYNKLVAFIDGADNTITDTQASTILMKAMEFKRGVFEITRGSSIIINKQGINDGVRYKLDEVDFSDYNATRTRIINNVLSQYNGYTAANIYIKPEVRAQFIMGVNNIELYIPYSYTIDCKKFVINDADFVLMNTLEEFIDV
ncbi:hypothetical protein RV18_GL001038 [Enterococcus termitis]|nr:hypothetical protein RV18_GL001038 [Enterococcus termitis]